MDLIDRLQQVAELLLGRRADTLPPHIRQWLELRVERRDWLYSDVPDVKQLLPPCLRELLSVERGE